MWWTFGVLLAQALTYDKEVRVASVVVECLVNGAGSYLFACLADT